MGLPRETGSSPAGHDVWDQLCVHHVEGQVTPSASCPTCSPGTQTREQAAAVTLRERGS